MHDVTKRTTRTVALLPGDPLRTVANAILKDESTRQDRPKADPAHLDVTPAFRNPVTHLRYASYQPTFLKPIQCQAESGKRVRLLRKAKTVQPQLLLNFRC